MSAWELTAAPEHGLVRLSCVLRSPQGGLEFVQVPLVDPKRPREAAMAARTISRATAGAVSFGAVLWELKMAGAK
jgi:hypothetical protein